MPALPATPLSGATLVAARKPSASASTNSTLAKAGAAKVYHVSGLNASASTKFLKLYNKATAPTVGTDVPVLTLALPVGAFSYNLPPEGVKFPLGIGYGLTGAAPDNDTTALAAADVVGLNILYL